MSTMIAAKIAALTGKKKTALLAAMSRTTSSTGRRPASASIALSQSRPSGTPIRAEQTSIRGRRTRRDWSCMIASSFEYDRPMYFARNSKPVLSRLSEHPPESAQTPRTTTIRTSAPGRSWQSISRRRGRRCGVGRPSWRSADRQRHRLPRDLLPVADRVVGAERDHAAVWHEELHAALHHVLHVERPRVHEIARVNHEHVPRQIARDMRSERKRRTTRGAAVRRTGVADELLGQQTDVIGRRD